MKAFSFTIDDNIRFLKELTQRQPESLFAHPYMTLLRRLHERFDLKIQLNLFYLMDGFDLSQMTDRYRQEWQTASSWLKLSFHSERENHYPYQHSEYGEMYDHCRTVHREILRFAGPESLAGTTTIHCCRTTPEGIRALVDCGVRGLLGAFGTDAKPRLSYSLGEQECTQLRAGAIHRTKEMAFAAVDMTINLVELSDIKDYLTPLLNRDRLSVMIHEQFFYEDYRAYQPDFADKLSTVFTLLQDQGYQSHFLEELI